MMAARKAAPEAEIVRVNDEASLQRFADAGGGLMLVNRVLDGDFADADGIALIARLGRRNPPVRGLLVSNYADAQSSAEAVGALAGFGKRDIGSPWVLERIRAGVEAVSGQAAGATGLSGDGV